MRNPLFYYVLFCHLMLECIYTYCKMIFRIRYASALPPIENVRLGPKPSQSYSLQRDLRSDMVRKYCLFSSPKNRTETHSSCSQFSPYPTHLVSACADPKNQGVGDAHKLRVADDYHGAISKSTPVYQPSKGVDYICTIVRRPCHNISHTLSLQQALMSSQNFTL